MGAAHVSVGDLISQLDDRSARSRRSAAEKLRRLKDPIAGPALLDALGREIENPRTWETQYQLTMALGSCMYDQALDFLRGAVQRRAPVAAFVQTAIGDAVVRLGEHRGDASTQVQWCLATEIDAVMDGAFRAVAILKINLNDDMVRSVIAAVSGRELYDGLRFWPIVASTGWEGGLVREFLVQSASSPRSDISDAAKNSLSGVLIDYDYL
ncbi:hypothetical protein [Sinosporangium siamense]|uniref:HEAT repeat domain-containing protein n=1 Tax=Sinosporangium siamense TaxID=1367973 RepID=A0A919V9U4_9ACTN|nr:hypothetical protein [Sinosporangium siamense]GII90469.1 hypothetical protein Ssi02_07000 [Sinosporangium siamense]